MNVELKLTLPIVKFTVYMQDKIKLINYCNYMIIIVKINDIIGCRGSRNTLKQEKIMAENLLKNEFNAYAEWRKSIVSNISDYRAWLNEQELNDVQSDLRIQQLIDKVNQDQLSVAFVAEFSRGKTELINAIFFADYGQRLLPSSAGRTTMCPTELFYDARKPTAIHLLPIETRLSDVTTTEYKRYPEEWKIVEFDVDNNESMLAAFREVGAMKRTSIQEAESYGLFDPNSPNDATSVNRDGTIDIPRWRYAMINFPHPILEQGLIILDTPGLNAVGTEPELTLNMLPNAHAVLFVLSADTGVTKSESDIWHQYIGGNRWQQKGRLAVLNKIDGLWDGMKDDATIAQEINKQVRNSADLLGLTENQIFPISAQKALLAKVNGDGALLAKSQLPALEKALTGELIPFKKEIISENTQSEVDDLMGNTQVILDARIRGIVEQLGELLGLRGKNVDVIEQMMSRVKDDKEAFEKALQQFQALRSVYSQQANALFTLFGIEAIKTQIKHTKAEMLKANFTKDIRASMDEFFENVQDRFVNADEQINEIKAMMNVMYDKFASEHGLRETKPPAFSTVRYHKELNKLNAAYSEQFNTTFNMIVNEKMILIAKFFETLASRVLYVFELANHDVEAWLRAVISPMESQVREHQSQLRRRMESIKRIHQATDTIEDRIGELEMIEKGFNSQLSELTALHQSIMSLLVSESLSEGLAA